LKGLGYKSYEGALTGVAIKHPRPAWEATLARTKKKIGSAVMNAVFEELMERSAIALIRAVI
jgi:hypothetical protein